MNRVQQRQTIYWMDGNVRSAELAHAHEQCAMRAAYVERINEISVALCSCTRWFFVVTLQFSHFIIALNIQLNAFEVSLVWIESWTPQRIFWRHITPNSIVQLNWAENSVMTQMRYSRHVFRYYASHIQTWKELTRSFGYLNYIPPIHCYRRMIKWHL